VNDLPEDQRQVVMMRFAEQKSIREIAGKLGRSEGAVKQLQLRGLRNLRARFDVGKIHHPQRTEAAQRSRGHGPKKSGGKNV
jgi:RNA polymerase sigma-70 factor (ECF subfamily)